MIEETIPTPHFGLKPVARGKAGVVATSSPYATRAAIDILKSGGNACDAALCAAAVQTVTETHLTSITGCLSMLYYDAATKQLSYVNGNINTPLAPLPGFSAADVATGRGVAVPGWWGGFEAAHTRHCSKSRAELLRPAIAYARDGFPIYSFLFGEIYSMRASVGRYPDGRRIYMPNGSLPAVGELLKQPEAATTLERLAEQGSAYFYHGDFARRFCEVVQRAGGVITPADFERYEVRWQEPARGTYNGYDVVASPPPDNGGTHLIEALNMFELLDVKRLGPPTESGDTLYWMARIASEVMSDGGRMTDPATHDVPLDFITSKKYADMRLKLLKMAPARPAAPPAPPGTTHVTVIDGKGNVATMLHSDMALPWANGLFVDGIAICAAGGHFLRTPTVPLPGGRPSVYLAPNIIFKDGRVVLASGSPSVSLIANILQNTVNILDFGIPIEQSVVRPRFGAALGEASGGIMVEADLDEKVRAAAQRNGLRFKVVSPWDLNNGSFEGISVDPATGVMTARADPRRAGLSLAV